MHQIEMSQKLVEWQNGRPMFFVTEVDLKKKIVNQTQSSNYMNQSLPIRCFFFIFFSLKNMLPIPPLWRRKYKISLLREGQFYFFKCIYIYIYTPLQSFLFLYVWSWFYYFFNGTYICFSYFLQLYIKVYPLILLLI